MAWHAGAPDDAPLAIVDEAAHLCGVKPSDVLAHIRSRNIVRARRLAAYVMRHKLKLSLPDIGRVLGQADHTSAMHAIAKVTEDPELKAIGDALCGTNE